MEESFQRQLYLLKYQFMIKVNYSNWDSVYVKILVMEVVPDL